MHLTTFQPEKDLLRAKSSPLVSFDCKAKRFAIALFHWIGKSLPIVQALAPCLEAGCRWVDGLVPRHSLYG